MANTNSACLIAVDIGTTHVKAVLYEHGRGILDQEDEGYSTYYPFPGFVEQNPQEVFAAVCSAIQRVVKTTNVKPQVIQGLVFGGILQSLIPVDSNGNALCNSFTWADTRSSAQNAVLQSQINAEEVRQRTGCTLHPMYFLSRLKWVKEERPEVFVKAVKYISLKEFILDRLFCVQQIDHSTASGTGIWNMHTKTWDDDLLSSIGFSSSHFSQCAEPTSILPKGLQKEYASQFGLLEGTPGVIGAFDGALSHFGSLGLDNKRMSLTVGTGAAIRQLIPAPKVIPGCEAWCYYLADDNWLLGGVLHNAGNVMRWFADNFLPEMNTEEAFAFMNLTAEKINPGANGLRFLPLLGGERCPHLLPDATGLIQGLTFAHGRDHMIRAMMEGLAYNLFSIYRMLASDLQSELVVTGGIIKSTTWLKIVASLFNHRLWIPEKQETSVWGGVMLGLKTFGIFNDLHEANQMIHNSGCQEPQAEWHEAYQTIIESYDQLHVNVFGC